MKFFPSFFESRASKQSKPESMNARPLDARQAALARQEAHDKDAIAKAYLQYGPRVARHMARTIKQSAALKEGHTCPRSECLVLH